MQTLHNGMSRTPSPTGVRDVEDAVPYSLLRKGAIPYRKNQLSMIKVYRFRIVPPSRMPSPTEKTATITNASVRDVGRGRHPLQEKLPGMQTLHNGMSRMPSPTFCFARAPSPTVCFARAPSPTGVRDVEGTIPYIFLFCVIF